MQELLTLLIPERKLGPPTQFRPWHLLSAFLAFSQAHAPVGRYQLAKELGLGGGSIRSLISSLRRQGLIKAIGRRGHILSDTGAEYHKALQQVLVKHMYVLPTSYTIDRHNYACHLHNHATLVIDGVQQRDAAIQAGASGATTFIQDPDPEYITMPIAHRIPKREATDLLELFNLESGDVLIIGSATTKITARLGALAATLTLLMPKQMI